MNKIAPMINERLQLKPARASTNQYLLKKLGYRKTLSFLVENIIKRYDVFLVI